MATKTAAKAVRQPPIRVYLRDVHRKAFLDEVKASGLNYTQFVALVLENYLINKKVLAGRTELAAFAKYLQTKEGDLAVELSSLILSFERLLEKKTARYKEELESDTE